MANIALGYTPNDNPVVAELPSNNGVLAVVGDAHARLQWNMFVLRVAKSVHQPCVVVAGSTYPEYLSASVEVIHREYDLEHILRKTPDVIQRGKFGALESPQVVLLVSDLPESFSSAKVLEFCKSLLTLAREIAQFNVILPADLLSKEQLATVEHAVFLGNANPQTLAQLPHLIHSRGEMPEYCYSNLQRTITLKKP